MSPAPFQLETSRVLSPNGHRTFSAVAWRLVIREKPLALVLLHPEHLAPCSYSRAAGGSCLHAHTKKRRFYQFPIYRPSALIGEGVRRVSPDPSSLPQAPAAHGSPVRVQQPLQPPPAGSTRLFSFARQYCPLVATCPSCWVIQAFNKIFFGIFVVVLNLKVTYLSKIWREKKERNEIKKISITCELIKK